MFSAQRATRTQVPSAATTRRPLPALASHAGVPALNPQPVQGAKGRGLELLARLAQGAFGHGPAKLGLAAQAHEKLVQCVLEAAATAELEEKHHHRGQRQTPCPGEVAGLDAMGLEKSIGVEGVGKLGQQLADKRCGAYG